MFNQIENKQEILKDLKMQATALYCLYILSDCSADKLTYWCKLRVLTCEILKVLYMPMPNFTKGEN